MNSVRVRLSDSERSCAVDPGELQAFSKALLDEVLFEAAKGVAQQHAPGAVAVVINFRVVLDSDDGAVLIEY